MKRITIFILTAAAAAMLSACEAPAGNSANASANAANTATKPAAAPPTTEALLALDRGANEAFLKGDGKHFEDLLSDKYVSYDRGQSMSKADIVKMINETKCELKSWSLDDAYMTPVDADTAVLTYKGTWDGTCGGEKLPSPTRAASVYVRSGEKWQAVYHSETLIIDPKSAPPPPVKGESKKDDAKSDEAKTDALTDELMAVETKGWDAWKARDAAGLEATVTKDIAFVDVFGNFARNRSEAIKAWTGPKCEIKSAGPSNGHAVSISPTVALLTYRGDADGTCEGQKLGPLWGTTVFVKDGGQWKAAYLFESPA